MFRHILLATDLSDACGRACGVAAGLAQAHRARLTVLHVYVVSSATLGGTPPSVAERTWPGAVRARSALDRAVEGLRARGLRAEAALRFGWIPEQVIVAAREGGADLIVTCTRRRRGLARVWYRSVAEQIVRGSPVPVVVVPSSGTVVAPRRLELVVTGSRE